MRMRAAFCLVPSLAAFAFAVAFQEIRAGVAGRNEGVTKLVEPSFPPRLLTRRRNCRDLSQEIPKETYSVSGHRVEDHPSSTNGVEHMSKVSKITTVGVGRNHG
jgi:hypothetical protein